MTSMSLRTLIGALSLSFLLAACGGEPSAEAEHGHEEGENHAEAETEHGHEEGDEHAEAEEPRKGEHGGRLLEQDGISVELAIAEDGTPPKYQAWLYRDFMPAAQ